MTVYRLMYNPQFWGHAVQGHCTRDNGYKYGAWAYDPGVPPRDGVTINYDTHRPVYTGEQALSIQAEMRRRETIRGTMSPSESHPLSGLVICDECGYHVTHHTAKPGVNRRKTPYTYWQCGTSIRRKSFDTLRPCTQRGVVPDRVVMSWLNGLLQQIIDSGGMPDLSITEKPASTQSRLDAINAEISDLERQIGEMITEQAVATSLNVKNIYTEKIREAGERLDILRANQAGVSAEHHRSEINHKQQKHAIREIRRLKLQGFWEKPPAYVNRTLRQVFGPYRIALRDREVVKLRKP